MSTPAEYRKRASEAERQAVRVSSTTQRQQYLDLAVGWRRLADALEVELARRPPRSFLRDD